jgi:hypothetical protein
MLACQGKQLYSNPSVNANATHLSDCQDKGDYLQQSTRNATFSKPRQLTPGSGSRGSASTSHATLLRDCQVNQDQDQNQNQDSNNLEFLFWREGREIYDTIEVALPTKYAQLPVAPDGFFATRDAQGRTHYFVEADRGTMTLKRFTQKLLAYAAYCKTKRHTEKFKIRHFRVLTVTSSALRCENLTRAAAATPDVRDLARMFLFTSEEKLALACPESVFEKIWTMPGLEAPCSILGKAESRNSIPKGDNQPTVGTLVQ